MSGGGETSILTRQDALQALGKIKKNEDCNFQLVDFRTFRRSAPSLRSHHYEHYEVLCYANTSRDTGWVVCKYFNTGSCPLRSALRRFDPSKGGTASLGRHYKAHNSDPNDVIRFPRQLPGQCQLKIAHAAAIAAALDIRPLSFTENQRGMSF